MLPFLLASAVVVLLYMSGWFVVGIVRRRNDVVDLAWGPGIAFLAWIFIPAPGWGLRPWIVTVLVTVWGVRLAYAVAVRQRGKPEDPHYSALRKHWKQLLRDSFLQVFLLQGAFLWVIGLPILVIHAYSTTSLGWLDILGILVWIIGFLSEVIPDRTLRALAHRYVGEKAEHILWKRGHHPRVYGDMVQWWGIFLMALAVPYGFWSILGPLTVTVLTMMSRKKRDQLVEVVGG